MGWLNSRPAGIVGARHAEGHLRRILPEFTKQDRLRVYGNPEVSEKYGPRLKIDSILPSRATRKATATS